MQCEKNQSQKKRCHESPYGKFKIKSNWDFPGGPAAKTVLPIQGAQIRSLVQELRSHMLLSAAKKKKSKNKHCRCIHKIWEKKSDRLIPQHLLMVGKMKGATGRSQGTSKLDGKTQTYF